MQKKNQIEVGPEKHINYIQNFISSTADSYRQKKKDISKMYDMSFEII